MHRDSHRLLVVVLAAFVAIATVVVVFRPFKSDSSPRPRPDLQKPVTAFAQTNGIAPGVTAYVSGPKGTWSGAAGIADLKTNAPMTADARVRLESVSKAWTATLILQLAGDGKLRLDDTVAKWLPGLLPYGDRITIRQLLSHTSGMIDNNDVFADPAGYLARVHDPRLHAQLVALGKKLRQVEYQGMKYSPRIWIAFAGALPLRTAPGSTYHYSNIGYEVAGLVAEKVSGKPLVALNRDGIIRPLHLKSAAYDPQGAITGPHARLYYSRQPGSAKLDASDWHGGIGAEGGIVSNAHDEAVFLQALMQGKLLKPAQLAALQTPQPGAGLYTLGFVKTTPRTCGGVVYQHGGESAGDKTSVLVSEDGSRVAVVLANGSVENTTSYYDAVDNLADQLYCAS